MTGHSQEHRKGDWRPARVRQRKGKIVKRVPFGRVLRQWEEDGRDCYFHATKGKRSLYKGAKEGRVYA